MRWGFAWPADRRILYNRASARPDGKPWSERKKLVWWDEERREWTGDDVADFGRQKAPDYVPPPDAQGDEALRGDAPFLMHADGRTSIYKHLSEVSVSLGELVPRGRAVGLSGSTGYSTGPHAHVMLQEDCGADNCQSLPLVFEDVPGDGIPDTNQTVTSGNCP